MGFSSQVRRGRDAALLAGLAVLTSCSMAISAVAGVAWLPGHDEDHHDTASVPPSESVVITPGPVPDGPPPPGDTDEDPQTDSDTDPADDPRPTEPPDDSEDDPADPPPPGRDDDEDHTADVPEPAVPDVDAAPQTDRQESGDQSEQPPAIEETEEPDWVLEFGDRSWQHHVEGPDNVAPQPGADSDWPTGPPPQIDWAPTDGECDRYDSSHCWCDEYTGFEWESFTR